MCFPAGEFKTTNDGRILLNVVVANDTSGSQEVLSCELVGSRDSDELQLGVLDDDCLIETSIGFEFSVPDADADADAEPRFDRMRMILDMPLATYDQLLCTLHQRTRQAFTGSDLLPYGAQERCVDIVEAVCNQLRMVDTAVASVDWATVPIDSKALNPIIDCV